MALEVENGSGGADADSYLSLDAFKAYCDDWGYDYTASDDLKIEQRLRLATNYIDTVFRYKGARANPAQALEFPRTGLTDWSGHEVAGVPKRVQKACAELAFKALSAPLYTDEDRGGMVASKSVGPLSISYEAGAPVGKTYRAAEKLLEQYVRKHGEDINGPVFTTPEAPSFTSGMHDDPGASYDPVS